jgi:hypothetical protein
MVSWSFGVEFFESLRYRIMSSANRDILTVSLLFPWAAEKNVYYADVR